VAAEHVGDLQTKALVRHQQELHMRALLELDRGEVAEPPDDDVAAVSAPALLRRRNRPIVVGSMLNVFATSASVSPLRQPRQRLQQPYSHSRPPAQRGLTRGKRSDGRLRAKVWM
jgi:hypothetical protein